MPTQNSPYSAFATLLASSGQPISPAELHGLLLGRSCAGAGFEPAPWLMDASDLFSAEPEENIKQALIGLQQMVKAELTGDEITVVLLLPNDDAPLAERAIAMGQWCQGFLAGFGLTARDAALSAEAMEVLQDLAAIAQVQEALEESEDGENDYMEVMEYLRVAPLLLFTECVKPAAPAAPKPSLH
ncbi:MAG: YecA family protein [Pseudomonas sp.]|uniref:YecA/YgfB family protein n=1 Tax=Pseudomonas sp. TaxID=306 RepID=UPI0030F08238